ncbi:hypothetical protein K504DRAFT_462583 [Pleomassaria siparia CBS 279.74]|uniref:Uncharacterized protein n=1 Tax=Pleomassaria siparia CBS 279.74 TaxID=1314801 RepID=A0A6G1KMT0_9PLEO|nr:hypothetical protein K504DRAFT_462583 [Pleomassaria siparia CBS 279.74]
MCLCTEYSASTCGHSWISLSHPCGPFRNLLSCQVLETFQTLVAPAFTCPQCHAGFQNEETLRMIGNGWAGPTMVVSNDQFGGNGSLGGWGGNRQVFPHSGGGMGGFGGGFGMGLSPLSNVVVNGGHAASPMMPMIQGGGCGMGGGAMVPGMGGEAYHGEGGFFRASNRNKRRIRQSHHHFSESSPAGCNVM